MRKTCFVVGCSILLAGFVSLGTVRSADAYLTFCKAFLQKYVGDESTDVQKNLAKEIARVKKCHVCHDPRKGEDGKVSKKNRNPYGQALNKFLTEKDKKDFDKALEMLKNLEDQKPEGSEKTFGELIKEGKLPFEFKDFKQDKDEKDDDDDDDDGK